jgi:ubiquinone/menaquinone biosynthesis C-methylase UbiE
MTEDTEPSEVAWAQRAKHWADAAPKSKSTNDEPNQLLIELAAIEAGDHVLDLASGTGEPAISIALKVGEAGSVIASDANADMLSAARRRADALRLANISFEVCRMEELPFEDDRFDAVTCRFGLMHAEDAAKALAGARRVLKPGGRIAVMVHGPAEKNTIYPLVRSTLFAFLGEEDTSRAVRRFRFSGAGELTELLTSAGFADVEEREISNTVTKPRAEKFWHTMLERAFGPKVAPLDEIQRQSLDRAIEKAFERYLDGDEYRLQSTERVARGTA